MELDKAIQSRKSVRKFISKKPDWKKIIECIDGARYAPMAGNNFTLKFIVVNDKEKIQKIADAAQQPFISQVHYLVAVCSNPSRTINAYKNCGEKFLRQQAGAAMQNFLLKLQEADLSTCWIGYFVESIIKRELKIPENVNVEAIFPIGYELEKPKIRKTKIDLDRILYFERYGNNQMKNSKEIDV